MNIFLTGATGFIGRALHPELTARNHSVTCAVRRKSLGAAGHVRLFDHPWAFNALDGQTDFNASLENMDVVIHLAALAHIPETSDPGQHRKYLEVNFLGTRNLARQAALKGVKRFVFISSTRVNGTSTPPGKAFTEEDQASPKNSYAVSKFAAEQALRKIETETGMDVVIIRPPLVYGPGVKANFLKLLNLVHTRMPLPFAGIHNHRSFIALDNLVDAIAACVVHEKAGGRTFLVSDGPGLSTPQLIRKISMAMKIPSRMFYVPPAILKAGLTLLKKQGIHDRLWGSLAVDSAKIQRDLGWQPKVSVDEGIQKMVQWYLDIFFPKRNRL